MNRSQEIFQEIENKLVKDDYASTLPVYHPAKGRRKKTYNGQVNTFKGAVDYVPVSGETSSTITSQDPIPDPEKKKEFPDNPPDKPEIDNPDEEEFDPRRDFPGREIEKPGESEIPDEPEPEFDEPDEEEFEP